jgi:hypothetical protein
MSSNSSKDPLVPRFTLDQLAEIGERHALENDIPISGGVALGIIRDETLAHLYVAMDRIPPALAKLDVIIAALKSGNSHRAKIQQIIAALGPLSGLNAFGWLRVINQQIQTTQDEVEIIQACLKSIKDLQQSFKPLAFKGVAAYVMGFVTGGIITALAIALELLVAYLVARWIEPAVKPYLSFGAAVLVLFLGQYFGLSPIISRLIESLYWLIYRHRLKALRQAVHNLDAAVSAI